MTKGIQGFHFLWDSRFSFSGGFETFTFMGIQTQTDQSFHFQVDLRLSLSG